MATLAAVAEDLGMRSLPVSLPPDVLADEVPLPCIAHWQDRHFVVVHRITKSRFHVADPAMGNVTYSHEEFFQSWLKEPDEDGQQKGAALVLEPSPSFDTAAEEFAGKEGNKRGFGFFARYLKPHRPLIVQLLSLIHI